MSNLGRLTTMDMDSRLSSEQNTYADIEAAYRCLKVTYGVKEDVILYGDVLITAANSKKPTGGSFSQTTTWNVGHREELLLHSTSQLGSNWEFNSREYNAIMANGAAVFSSNSSRFHVYDIDTQFHGLEEKVENPWLPSIVYFGKCGQAMWGTNSCHSFKDNDKKT
ncbi:hypothetical protein L1987_19602 [Smallanthus sonchifolius]|uniref:Uncharacterized protein n=1 Tax=Smallanthus sonchifolius TaxID=185202 RepID=A0ACB9ISG6_9ASTR|nr:hypothetical protein L1987_19602 [Smallanthus sonchifolius]